MLNLDSLDFLEFAMKTIDHLVIFDIEGPMAHFRAFYTNTSSLSYAFPPRTIITGIIAGLLGWEKDSYYEAFSSDYCRVALSILQPIRKIMQTLNYVRTKSVGEFNASAGPTQVPLEIIVPAGKEKTAVSYRIYFTHGDLDVMQDLAARLENNKVIYPPYLGLSEFIAKTKFVDYINKSKIEEVPIGTGRINTSTVVNADKIKPNGLVLESEPGVALQYIKERMPLELDANRRLKRPASFIYEKNLRKIVLTPADSSYRISYKDHPGDEKSETVMFME